FLIGIFYGSITMGAVTLLSTVSGIVTALLFKYDKNDIDKGLYGFNAALVGVAGAVFLKPIFLSFLIIIIGSMLATVFQHFFMKLKIPVFTLPFVLVIWGMLLIYNTYFPEVVISPVAANLTNDYFSFAFKGFGQVIFQNSLVSGLLFFIAVFISSPISALYGIAGAVFSAIIAFKFSSSVNDISVGLFSYNAVLCAIVFAGTKIIDGVWLLLAVAITLFTSFTLLHFGIEQLTFPFIFASFVIIMIKNKFNSTTTK
ncbi:MAG: urea transporter, partial [Bacteroidales bacterium]|nr:urea transporter [Bacteroidales bacterium]